MVTDDEPSSLTTALKARDRSAWTTAVDRHLGELYGFVFHLVGGDRALAEELNQEVWMEAIDGIDRCDADRGSFRGWLFGIARRRVALCFRRRGPAAGRPLSLGDGFEASVMSANHSILPEDVLEQMEQRSVVRAAMLALPADRRRALVWKYVEGLSVEAIATRMDKTAKAVESLLGRARQQARGLLSAYMTPCHDRQPANKESRHD